MLSARTRLLEMEMSFLRDKMTTLRHKWDNRIFRLRFANQPELKKCTVWGPPCITVGKDSHVEIGNRVLLNSDQRMNPHGVGFPVRIAVAEGAKLRIGSETRIHSSAIRCENEVVIGDRCLIAAGCQLMDASGHNVCEEDVTRRIHERNFEKETVRIEDDVWLGLNVIVLPGVTIGAGSVVAAGSVVSRDVPARCVVAGVPAKVVREF